MRQRRRGFTLLELLVVIAILAILMSMTAVAVFQVMRTSRERVERAAWKLARSVGDSTRRTVPLRVLFIGNSYTSVNDLPGLVQALAEAAGNTPALIVDRHLVGGATLEQHWNEGEAVRKIRAKNWDLVVLQEQSQRPMFERAPMFQYARLLDDAIREQDAISLFYLTWARRSAPETQKLLTAAYMTIAKERKAEVSPVGLAWERALKQDPTRVLHMPDDSHPTPLGSYLAACVFYSAIFDRSPAGLPGTLQKAGATLIEIPSAQAQALQEIAWTAYQDTKLVLLRYRGLRTTGL